ncbi:DUF55-domain-containing protein [Schizopora paradoxa]|uniref:DUF55-domain-containing protein n=1 Tax=Schizopora paradoxa TaxID=27342 RepID=A0A0H2R9E1_9AGAM|nr:DUF55-domain-containing protein [Schizopora paradoxa]
MEKRFWLMKAEPDSRIVKGKDVKFSVDDFESVKTSPWEGVRNHEAKKLMQQMKLGDEIAFYHSNCKNPGIAGFAEVEKEAYPDYTSWDPDHPYFDPKTDKESPKWFMVDVTFKSRAKNFVSLALMKRIAAFPTSEPSEDLAYIGNDGVEAIKNMALIKRGRLSVQPVEEDAWTAIHLLADNGGWEENEKKSKKGKAEAPKTTSRKRKKEETRL